MVTVTNTDGCTATSSVFVNVSAAPTASVSVLASACNGSASLTATGGSNYLWSTGETTSTIQTTTNGNYTVTVTNSGGCTATASGSVSIPAPPQVQVSGPAALCSGNMATLEASSGFASYLWSNGATGSSIMVSQSGSYSVTATDAAGCTATDAISTNFFPLPVANINGPTSFCTGSSVDLSVVGNYASIAWGTGANTPSITASQPGDYTVTVTDAQGCTATDSQTLTASTSLSPAIVQTMTACNGTVMLDAGTGFNSYAWSNGATTPSISVSQAGTYSVTVSDAAAGGCTGAASTNVALPVPPVASITGPSTACAGATVNLTAGGGFNSYNWSTGEATASIAVSQPGNYAVTVTNAAGCTATASQQFDVLVPPSISIAGPTAACAGSTANLVVSGNSIQASWSTGETTNSIAVSQSGNYAVTVTNAAGCTATASHQFDVLAPPSLSLSGPAAICTGSTANLVVSGNFTQAAWSTGATTLSIPVSQSGNYSVTVTAANGCTANASQQLAVSSSLSPDIVYAVQPCIAAATLDAGAGYASYQWSNGALTPMISVTQPGSYSVTVGDGTGCTGNDAVAVSFPNLPAVQILGTTSICTGGNAGFSISGNFPQVIWSTGEASSSISVSQPGNYSVTVTDTNGCTATATQALSVGTSLSPQITTTDLGCNGTATLDAGAGLYANYFWSNGATTPSINVSQAGTYSVSVSDASGCTGEAVESVAFPTPPQVQILGPTSVCAGSSAAFSLSGIYPSIIWNNGSTAPSISVSQSGNYSVTVTDANGCTATDAQALSLDAAPSPVISPSNIGCNGTATLDAGGGFSSYLWSNGAVTPTINVTQSGTYLVTVTNASGCTGIGQLALTLPPPPQAGISGPAQLCEGYDEILSAPANFASYLWSTGAISPQITITAGGQYGLTVTDGNGCTATATWAVTLLPTQYSYLENHSCNLQDTGTVVMTLTSQTGCDSVVTVATLLNPSLTGSLSLTACTGASAMFNGVEIQAGNTQDFTLASAQGCDSILTVIVEELPAVSLAWQATPSCWNGSDGVATLTASAGTPPFQYALDGGSLQSNPVFLGLAAGSYVVAVQDINGCTVEIPLEIPATSPTTIVLDDVELHCGEDTVQLSPQVLSGDANAVVWRWSTGAETKDLQVSTPGRFTLTADDGCELQSFTATVLPSSDWDKDYFYVPNSFSPNGDGINDYFRAFVGQDVEVRSFDFKVFDRWGNSMFSTTDHTSAGWDGLHRLDQMQGAVFGWYLKAVVGDCLSNDKEVFEEGGVTIVR